MTTPHEPAETPTPRSDKEWNRLNEDRKSSWTSVAYDMLLFGKQLERENEELRKALREYDATCTNFFMARAYYDESSEDREQMAREVSGASCRLSDAQEAARAILARANRQGGAQG